jgi:hypothetical protein
MRLTYGTRQLDSFSELVARIPDSQLEKLTCSTVPLMAWWRDETNLQALREALRLPALSRGEACFEHTTAFSCSNCTSPGTGKVSCTDVMLDLGTDVVAIEAKHTERLYPTVAEWMGTPPSRNKEDVLRHWLSCCIGADLEPAARADLVYQMVHRTASACALAATRNARPHVVHLLFGSEHAEEYQEASQRLTQRLLARSPQIRFAVLNVPTRATPAQRAFEELTPEDHRKALRTALVEGPALFEFGAPVVVGDVG